ncbi:MAG: hypothetical protein ACYC56_06435 [Candidatus Aquicultor sp.]
MMVGVKNDKTLDVKDIEKKVRTIATQRLGLKQLDFSFYADPATISKLAHGTLSDGSPIPLNTDDRPLLEFIAPKNHIEFFREGTKGIN